MNLTNILQTGLWLVTFFLIALTGGRLLVVATCSPSMRNRVAAGAAMIACVVLFGLITELLA